MRFRINLAILLTFFLFGCLALTSCSRPDDPVPNPNPDPNPPPTKPLEKSQLIGWWFGVPNQSGYRLLYLGNDSFYLQQFLGNFMPGEWTFENDSITIEKIFTSKLTLTGDTLLKFSYANIAPQYYVRYDSPLIVNHSPRLTTIAGTGLSGPYADNSPAITASIYTPYGVTVDNSGDIFFTERGQNRIRKIKASNGTISTFAGTGSAGFSGDGGPASQAMLNLPTAITSDAAGNIYFIDSENRRIRKISPDGTINTIAGTGVFGSGGDNGPATSAQMREPAGITVDNSGNVFFSEAYGANRIRKISTNGIITTIAGTGVEGYSGDGGLATAAKLNQPMGLATDNAGDIIVADSRNHCIRKIIVSSGQIVTIAGKGSSGFSGDSALAASATLFGPNDVTVDASNNIFIIDVGNQRIRKVAASNGMITTICGNGKNGHNGDAPYADWCSLSNPVALTVDNNGNIIFADKDSRRIRKLTNRH